MAKCLLDLDGVLTDLMTVMYSIFGTSIHPQGEYDLSKVFGMTQSKIWTHPKIMDEYFWATLPKMPEADAIVEYLEFRFGVDNICILTAPVSDSKCAGGKIEWIRRNYPQFRRQFLVGPAKEFCAGDKKYLVDDSDMNIQKFRANGGKGILVPAQWNSDFKNKDRALVRIMEQLSG